MTTKQNGTNVETEESLAICSAAAWDAAAPLFAVPALPGRVLATRYADREGLFTALCACDGEDRAEFDTACAICYGIYIADRGESVFLPDLARGEEEAFLIFARFADGCVTPSAALEVADALLG